MYNIDGTPLKNDRPSGSAETPSNPRLAAHHANTADANAAIAAAPTLPPLADPTNNRAAKIVIATANATHPADTMKSSGQFGPESTVGEKVSP